MQSVEQNFNNNNDNYDGDDMTCQVLVAQASNLKLLRKQKSR
jgi:hypothetical protein